MKNSLLFRNCICMVFAWYAYAVAADEFPQNTAISPPISITAKSLGSGTPATNITVGNELAGYVADDYYHVPQFLPFYPTAAVLWPRVVAVECSTNQTLLVCDGIQSLPQYGRGEYLFIKPVVRSLPPVQPQTIIVYKEVPHKKKSE